MHKVATLIQRTPADLPQPWAEAKSFSPEDREDAPKGKSIMLGAAYMFACD